MSKSLLKSVAEQWKDSETLCALIPFERFFTGRVPQTSLYRFPYVSILATQGSQTHRTDKTRISHGPLSFHVWVDDADLEFGEKVAQAITDVYADRCWPLGGGAKVMDVLDEGEPMAHQTDLPNVKAWEVVKLFTVCIERQRADHDECCEFDSHSGSAASGEFASSAGSSSSQSSSNV